MNQECRSQLQTPINHRRKHILWVLKNWIPPCCAALFTSSWLVRQITYATRSLEDIFKDQISIQDEHLCCCILHYLCHFTKMIESLMLLIRCPNPLYIRFLLFARVLRIWVDATFMLNYTVFCKPIAIVIR